MTISIITLFPEMFSSVFASSILKRAQEDKKIIIHIINLRDFGIGRHKVVDDAPYGGGVGMVLRVDVLARAIESARINGKKEKVILLDPAGAVYKQKTAEKLAKLDHIILVCGHYEGFDARIYEFVDSQLSIGDYVLSGGEIPAMVVTESIVRLSSDVLKKDAHSIESFSEIHGQRLLEFPQYTRPEEYMGRKVPDVLRSGNFAEIEKYRIFEAEKRTKKDRPDLMEKS